MEKLSDVIERTDAELSGAILDVFLKHRLSDDDALLFYDALSSWRFRLNDRANSRFGVCKFGSRIIELNMKLLDFPMDYRQTLIHETAHAIEFMIYGDSDHGPRWRSIMRDLGALPNRVGSHTKEAADALHAAQFANAREIWACDKCGVEVPIARKRKYPANTYSHNNCGGRFSVVDIYR